MHGVPGFEHFTPPVQVPFSACIDPEFCVDLQKPVLPFFPSAVVPASQSTVTVVHPPKEAKRIAEHRMPLYTLRIDLDRSIGSSFVGGCLCWFHQCLPWFFVYRPCFDRECPEHVLDWLFNDTLTRFYPSHRHEHDFPRRSCVAQIQPIESWDFNDEESEA